MTLAKFDPKSVAAGSEVHIANTGGWGVPDVLTYKVVRITPGGQIVARLRNSEIRINAHGNIVGEGAYGRTRAITPDRAAEYIAARAIELLWAKVRVGGGVIEKAARQKDAATLATAVAGLSAATDALARATGETA